MVRKKVREVLELIGDPRAQREYERSVPIADVPAELLSLWFDDHYHPNDSRFKQAFSTNELHELAAFNDFYDERVNSLPTTAGVAALQQSSAWAEIVDRANTALRRLGRDEGDRT